MQLGKGVVSYHARPLRRHIRGESRRGGAKGEEAYRRVVCPGEIVYRRHAAKGVVSNSQHLHHRCSHDDVSTHIVVEVVVFDVEIVHMALQHKPPGSADLAKVVGLRDGVARDLDAVGHIVRGDGGLNTDVVIV